MPNSTFTFQDNEYEFSPEQDVSISVLRHIKQWYGKLGSYSELTSQASYGDPDALSCVIWIAQRRAGVSRQREPMNLPDFSVSKVMGSFVTDGKHVHTPMPPVRLEIDGVPYTFDIGEQLTCNTLKKIKGWYPDLGSLVQFTLAFLKGDPDAMASVAWIVRTAAGEECEDPRFLDFAVGEVIDSYDMDPIKEIEDPEPPEILKDEKGYVDPPRPSDGESLSEGIQTNSGGDTISTSPPSSISRQRKPKSVPS